MVVENKFLGHPVAYWIELQRRVDALNCEDLLVEVVKLRGELNYYRSRIKQMAEVMANNNG